MLFEKFCILPVEKLLCHQFHSLPRNIAAKYNFGLQKSGIEIYQDILLYILFIWK